MKGDSKKAGSNHLNIILMFVSFLLYSCSLWAQTESQDYAEIYVYRAKQGMITGANSLDVKVEINGKTIGNLSNGTKLLYKIHSEGEIKLKCIGTFGQGAIGSPYVTTLQVKHGESYHIALVTSSITGVKGSIMDEAKIKEMSAKKFSDENEYEEDLSDPVIVEKEAPKDNGPYAEIYVYRAKQGMITGANSLDVVVEINGQVIGNLSNGTKLKYKMHTEGKVKLKCIGNFGQGAVGVPYVINLDVENGKEFHIALVTSSITGVKGSLLDEAGIKGMSDKQFLDENEYEEDPSNPITFEKETPKENGPYAEIFIYRAKQVMMTGANSIDVTVLMNDQEVGHLANATKMSYKVYSEGKIKVKSIGTFAKGSIGSPFVATFDVKHGEEYHIALSVFSAKGLRGHVMDEKMIEEMETKTFVDESQLEEDKSNPLIK